MSTFRPLSTAQAVESEFLWFPRRSARRAAVSVDLEEPAPSPRCRRGREQARHRFPAGGGYRILRCPRLLDAED